MEITKEIAQELLSTYRAGKDFVIEQAPEVVRQLVVLKQVQFGGICGLIFLAGLFAVWWGTRPFFKVEDAKYDPLEPLHIVGAICGGFVALFAGLTFFIDGLPWIVAPKVAILNYLMGVVR